MNNTSTAPTLPRNEASILRLIGRIPQYLRLLVGMLRDARVSLFDRLLVVATAVYVVSPIDILPDFIPVLGQIDDLFLVAFALGRMFERAGREVILSHWRGEPEELDPVVLRKLLQIAAFFAPPGRRGRFRALAGGKSRA